MEKRKIKIERFRNGEKLRVELKKPKREYAIHTHDYFEIEFIVSGGGVNVINNSAYPLKRGSVMFLTPADCHSVSLEHGTKLWNISFDECLLSEEVLQRAYTTKEYKNYFEEEEFVKLEACALLLQKELQTTKQVECLLEYLTLLILPKNARVEDNELSNVVNYININFRENPTISDMAKMAYLSPVYFGHVFKKRFGISYSNYLNKKKVEFAKKLLHSGMNVTEACFESGFNSLSNFLKCFKLETGLSPKEYQKCKRKNLQ